VKTNAWFLARLLGRPEFRVGDVTTGFIAEHIDDLCEPPFPSGALLQYAADDLAFDASNMSAAFGSALFELTQTRFGFRLNAPPRRDVRLGVNGHVSEVEVGDDALWYDHTRTTVKDGPLTTYFEDGAAFVIGGDRAYGSAAGTAADGAILSPMPGRIIAVDVAEGETVTKGQKLVTLEAMKMEHSLVAPFDGTVETLAAAIGGQVSEGAVLAKITATA
jgi:3-methylcrotonyl-CoA carboxylase alpha subunit